MDYREIAFLVGRVLLALYFIRGAYAHFDKVDMLGGYAASKGVPAAKAGVVISGVLLLIGGLSLLLGRDVEIGLWCLVAFLVPVTLLMHQYWKIQDPMARMSESINFWKNVALLGAVLMLMSLPMGWSYTL